MIVIKITFIIIASFAIGFFFGAAWIGLAKKKQEVEPFDESDIYKPTIKTFRNEKHRQ